MPDQIVPEADDQEGRRLTPREARLFSRRFQLRMLRKRGVKPQRIRTPRPRAHHHPAPRRAGSQRVSVPVTTTSGESPPQPDSPRRLPVRVEAASIPAADRRSVALVGRFR